MSSNMIDMAGRKCHRLLVVRRAENAKGRKAVWECVCDCGNTTSVEGYELRSGGTKSCGCLPKEQLSALTRTHGHSGNAEKRAYATWKRMRTRCLSRSSRSYGDYGGRGITICERWSSFENFLADMGEPDAGMSIDRINVDGNYEPSNCRWASPTTQNRNRRNSKLTESKVSLIRERLTRGVNQRLIAEEFAISQSMVSAIARGHQWKLPTAPP